MLRVPQALSACYDASEKGCFRKEAVSNVMAAIKADPSLANESEKNLMKIAMPFTKFMMEKAATAGPSVLDVVLPFGESSTLADNLEYMMRALKLEALDICSINSAESMPQGCENVYPGNPALIACHTTTS